MSQLVDVLIKRKKLQEKYFRDYLGYAQRIKKIAEKILGEAKVIIFGSILRKDEVPRDIDILIVSPKLKEVE